VGAAVRQSNLPARGPVLAATLQLTATNTCKRSNHFPASPDFGAVLAQATEESASIAGWHKFCALSHTL
jgi:hypothetical protein